MIGNITVITGPMFASKTSELIKMILWNKYIPLRKVYVFKPIFDDRYSVNEIISHNGISIFANPISFIPEIESNKNTIIFFDEIQFFVDPFFNGNIISFIKECRNNGIDIVCNGLDMDWQGNQFEITSNLMGIADKVIKKKANCSICGKQASKTFKISGNTNNNDFELGSKNLYEPRCNEHFKYE